MEAHFHGASSGGDPLICYLNKPVLMGEDGSFTEVKMPGKLPLAVGLVDTKLPRKTAPLVQHFLEKCEDKNFKTAIENELVIYNEKAIQSFLDGRDDVLDWTRRISKFQFKHFQKMIPASFSSLWENGLATNKYYLKLCGAGGGGFLLAFSSDSVMFQNELTDQAIIPVEF